MIGAWIERQSNRLHSLTLRRSLLLWLVLVCASFGLAAVLRSIPFLFFPTLTSICLLVAWGISRTRLSGWGYGLTGTLLGVFGVSVMVGGVGGSLIRLASSLITVSSQMLGDVSSNFSRFYVAWLAFSDSLVLLMSRFSNWLRAIRTGTPIIDPVVITILWGTALWVAVLWARWWVQKRNHVLIGALPTIVLLGWNTYYTHSTVGITWLIFTLGAVLTLRASISYDRATQRWAANRIERGNIEAGLVFSVVLLSSVMVILASFLPSIPIKEIANLVDDLFEQPADPSLARSLGLEQTPVGGSAAESHPTPTRIPNAGANAPASHHIGAAPALAQDVVMLITVDEYSPPPIDEFATIHTQESVPYYWRAQTYQNYNGQSWLTGDTRIREFEAGQSLPVSNSTQSRYIPVTQHVTRLQPDNSTVFASGELLSLDQSSRTVTDGNGEIISAYTETNPYTAFSRINALDVGTLRAAGTDYPLTTRAYLQLPNDLPPRVRDLALTLTAGEDTPFDKAVVLETYLRQFPYSLDVPAPPQNRDAVDYFLFDLHKGYCDYYATAMVVMARAAGLPARLVLGYSQGAYDRTNEHFVIRDSNAHTWVEVYFPDIGWVAFEPTPSQPNIFRPGQNATSSQRTIELLPPGQEAPLSIHLGYSWQGRTLLILMGCMAVIFMSLFLPLETWWLSLLPVEKTLDAIMRRLYRRGRSVGIEPNPSRTPNDFVHALSIRLEQLDVASETRLESNLRDLVSLYNRQLFSKHSPEQEELKAAVQTWKRIREEMKQVGKKKIKRN